MKKFPPLPILDILDYTKTQAVACVGRENEIQQLTRTLSRRNNNNLLLVGRRGIGKSTLVYGLAQAISKNQTQNVASLPILRLGTAAVTRLLHETAEGDAGLHYVKAALTSLPSCILIIDDADKLCDEIQDVFTFENLFAPFINSPQKRLVLVFEEELFGAVQSKYNRGFKTFETFSVNELPSAICEKIVRERAQVLGAAHAVTIESAALPTILKASLRLPSNRSQPDRAVRFLDEVCAAATTQENRRITSTLVEHVVAQRLGLPTAGSTERKNISSIKERLAGQVIGQSAATNMVADIIKRSFLGLKNPSRPMGSFLFLGPSGVGKTELAKVVAKEVYGSERALVRIDMSEFSDAHTTARLIGAPPGYVGYEAGGQLTNPIAKQPFSLVLLDEIEKAHPTIFDIFLQVFDDGRLTDGQGHTVDFTNTIIMATSNIGIRNIVEAVNDDEDVTTPQFLSLTMMPLLREKFRLEFLNRFEGIVVFRPLTPPDLKQIARLEIKKLENRLSHHNLKIKLSDEDIEALIAATTDSHLGARPLRRALEQHVERAVAQTILK